MKLSIAAYEKLLTYRAVRVALVWFTRLRALAAIRLQANVYNELVWLLRTWRALNSVRPWSVPNSIVQAATEKTMALISDSGRAAFHDGFLRSRNARAARRRFEGAIVENRVRLRLVRESQDVERQGNLMILKPLLPRGEKGVILAKYSPTFASFAAAFDIDRLALSYRLVLEPSTWGYQDADILLYYQIRTEVIIQSQYEEDFRYIDSLGGNFRALNIGAGDWVDSERFWRPCNADKSFDIVMIASWDRLKRHWLLFDAMRTLGDKISKVALVGMPAGRRKQIHVEREAKRAGVYRKLEWFERLPHEQVADVLSRARLSVMLSTREGASRAIYESLFCDVPVIVSKCNIGVNRQHVCPSTGLFCADADLANRIAWALAHLETFAPRCWALNNTGWPIATARLQSALRRCARAAGEPWTADILPKVNAPNLRYVSRDHCERSRGWYIALGEFLRSVS